MNDQPKQSQPDAQVPAPAAPAAPTADATQLAELEQLIAELKERVTALRAGEFDAAALELQLRELNELAVRAAGALDTAAR